MIVYHQTRITQILARMHACMHACQLVIWYTAYTQQSVHCVITLYMFKFTRFSSDMHVVTHMLSVP
jgi:hypothetical protein